MILFSFLIFVRALNAYTCAIDTSNVVSAGSGYGCYFNLTSSSACKFNAASFVMHESTGWNCGSSGDWYIQVKCDDADAGSGKFPDSGSWETGNGITGTYDNTGSGLSWTCSNKFAVYVENANSFCDETFTNMKIDYDCGVVEASGSESFAGADVVEPSKMKQVLMEKRKTKV